MERPAGTSDCVAAVDESVCHQVEHQEGAEGDHLEDQVELREHGYYRRAEPCKCELGFNLR